MKNFGDGFMPIMTINEAGQIQPTGGHIAIAGRGMVLLPPLENTKLSGQPSERPTVSQPRVGEPIDG